MKKQDLRTLYKQKREALIPEEITVLQHNIYAQIYALDVTEVNTIHLFLTLEKLKEIDTEPIIKHFKKLKKQIVVSKCNFKNSTLTHFYLEDDTILELNKFGVPEPISARPADEQDLDLVFVPLLISDKQNYRVGYGKGFYDCFLSNCRKDCKTIGLNFFKPIATIDDINEFDIALNNVIYPK